MTFTITIKPVLDKMSPELVKKYGKDWHPVRAIEFHVIEDDFVSAQGHLEDLFPYLKSDQWEWSFGPYEWERKVPSKEEILKRFENLSPENRKKALRIIDENMSLANRKHDLALLVDLGGYPDLSAIRMNEILEAVRKGGA